MVQMSKIKKNQKIKLFIDGANRYAVANTNNDVIYKHSDSYFIYFKNVNFRTGGIIEGRYLGEASDALVDEYCKSVNYHKNNGFTVDEKKIRTAKMVAVHNKKRRTLIIIQ